MWRTVLSKTAKMGLAGVINVTVIVLSMLLLAVPVFCQEPKDGVKLFYFRHNNCNLPVVVPHTGCDADVIMVFAMAEDTRATTYHATVTYTEPKGLIVKLEQVFRSTGGQGWPGTLFSVPRDAKLRAVDVVALIPVGYARQ